MSENERFLTNLEVKSSLSKQRIVDKLTENRRKITGYFDAFEQQKADFGIYMQRMRLGHEDILEQLEGTAAQVTQQLAELEVGRGQASAEARRLLGRFEEADSEFGRIFRGLIRKSPLADDEDRGGGDLESVKANLVELDKKNQQLHFLQTGKHPETALDVGQVDQTAENLRVRSILERAPTASYAQVRQARMEAAHKDRFRGATEHHPQPRSTVEGSRLSQKIDFQVSELSEAPSMARGAKDVSWTNPRPSQESNPPSDFGRRIREELDPILIVTNDSIAKRISESPVEDDFFRRHASQPAPKEAKNQPETKKPEKKVESGSNKKPEIRVSQSVLEAPKLSDSGKGIDQSVNRKLDHIKSSLNSYLNDNEVRKSQRESLEAAGSQGFFKKEEPKDSGLLAGLPSQFGSAKPAPTVIQQPKVEPVLEPPQPKSTGFFANLAKPTQHSVVKEEENDDFESDFEPKKTPAKPKSTAKKSKNDVSFGSDEFEDLF